MGLLDASLHLLNFFAPAWGVALLSSGMVKLLWWRPLRAVPWPALAVWSAAAGSLVLVAGLVLMGRDGRMATYGLLVLANACVLWWKGLRHLR